MRHQWILLYAVLCLGVVPASAANMVTIPSGPFTMGSDADDTAKPERRLFLESYEIDATEVSNAEFAARFPEHTYPDGAGDQPVTRVTWHEANRFCREAGKRLPTEVEWEKAARGDHGRIYPWGNRKPRKQPHPFYSGVAKRATGSDRRDVSPYGVRDMAGSVWEWTQSSQDGLRVVRGGLWNLHLDFDYSKTYERNLIPPDEKFSFLGFRCARSAP